MNSKIVVSKFEIKSIKEDDPQYFIIEGFASVYGNIDSYRDIVEKGAFSMDLMENGNERPILWQHNSSKPIGVGVFSESDQGLKVSCRLPKESEFVKKEVMPMVKCGAVKGMSIGYSVVTEEYNRETNVNYLKVLKLRENSIVTFPANEMAQITAAKQILQSTDTENPMRGFKFSKDTEEWDTNSAVLDIKKATNSKESPSETYKDCFLSVDDARSERFDGYHLPICKNVGGELRVIPEAIFKAAGKVASGKIDKTVDKSELEIIKSRINSLYKKLGYEEVPFGEKRTYIHPQTLKHMESIDRIFDDPDYIISGKAKGLIVDLVRDHFGCSPNEESDLLTALKRANNEMEKTL